MTNRQLQIIETSVSIIHNEGIQNFTIKNISRHIGISESAIYKHFKNKNDILIYVLNIFLEKFEKKRIGILKLKLSSLDKINLIFRELALTFRKNPIYVSVIFAEELYKNNVELLSKVKELQNIIFQTTLELVEEGQKKAEIISEINSKNLSLMIVGSFRLLIKRWKTDEFKFNFLKSSEKLLEDIDYLIQKRKLHKLTK